MVPIALINVHFSLKKTPCCIFFCFPNTVMRLMQYWSCACTRQPTSIEGFEVFAKKTILKDIYGFYSSGSIIGVQQTLHENNDAYTR